MLERGVVTPRDAQSRAWGGAGRPRGAVRAMPLLFLRLLPGAPLSPVLPGENRVHTASKMESHFSPALLQVVTTGVRAAEQHQAALGERRGLGHERDMGVTGRP